MFVALLVVKQSLKIQHQQNVNAHEFLGACVMTLEYLGLAILLVEFSIQTKFSAKLAAKGWNANRLKGSFALDTKREYEENSLDVESEAEVKNRKAKQSKEKALKIFIHLSLRSAEPSLWATGLRAGVEDTEVPGSFLLWDASLSLIFHLENGVTSPCLLQWGSGNQRYIGVQQIFHMNKVV